MQANTIGISRSRQTKKITAHVDSLGCPLRVCLITSITSDLKGPNLLIGVSTASAA